jgi:glucose/arabinose dehydrogenase
MLFVGTRKTTVWAVTDRNSDGVADEVKSFAPSLKFTNPNGVCWTRDGFLIVAEHNRVLNFPAAEFFYEGPDVAVIEVVPQGQLVPVEEESYNHGARTCRVSDDGKLYVTLGQPYNVQPRDKVALYEKLGIGGMIRLSPFDGSGREVVARGVRNSVGMDINPKDKVVWFTDNQTDGMGDETPPGELNRITKAGASTSAIRTFMATACRSQARRRQPISRACRHPRTGRSRRSSSRRTRHSSAWPSTTARCSPPSIREASSSPRTDPGTGRSPRVR